MIETIVAILAFFGFGIGDGEEPNKLAFQTDNQQIIRAIESHELKGLNNLESHDADEWFV